MDLNKMKTGPTGIRGTKKREESKKNFSTKWIKQGNLRKHYVIFLTLHKSRKGNFVKAEDYMSQAPYKNSEELKLLILKWAM